MSVTNSTEENVSDDTIVDLGMERFKRLQKQLESVAPGASRKPEVPTFDVANLEIVLGATGARGQTLPKDRISFNFWDAKNSRTIASVVLTRSQWEQMRHMGDNICIGLKKGRDPD